MSVIDSIEDTTTLEKITTVDIGGDGTTSNMIEFGSGDSTTTIIVEDLVDNTSVYRE